MLQEAKNCFVTSIARCWTVDNKFIIDGYIVVCQLLAVALDAFRPNRTAGKAADKGNALMTVCDQARGC